MTPHEIRTSHWQINRLHRQRGSRTALVAEVKRALRWQGHRWPIASVWPDGTVAIYECLADRRRDQTGEYAAAVVTTVDDE